MARHTTLHYELEDNYSDQPPYLFRTLKAALRMLRRYGNGSGVSVSRVSTNGKYNTYHGYWDIGENGRLMYFRGIINRRRKLSRITKQNRLPLTHNGCVYFPPNAWGDDIPF